MFRGRARLFLLFRARGRTDSVGVSQSCMVINGTSHAHIDIVGISQSCMVIIGVAFTINAGGC